VAATKTKFDYEELFELAPSEPLKSGDEKDREIVEAKAHRGAHQTIKRRRDGTVGHGVGLLKEFQKSCRRISLLEI
jgi:hypothetical protein